MNFINFSRFGVAALATCAVITLSSCNKKTDESASSDTSSSPIASDSTPSTTTSSSPASSTTSASSGKLGVAPQGTACPTGNPIKGITSKKLGGKIYLTSKFPDYSNLKPEKCFPDEDTAKTAGYQAPK